MFVVALAIVVILSALLLVYAKEMRTEAMAAGYRLSARQASAVELGAEQWALAQVEANTPALSGSSGSTGGTGTLDVTQIPAEAVPVGGGYFWMVHPDPEQTLTPAYGLVDESGKLSLNAATADQLILLPDITQEAADSIVAWAATTAATNAPSDAGDAGYYSGLPNDPYTLKTAPFETVEELLLVKGVTPAMLYGADVNRDGVVDDAEKQAATAANNGTDSWVQQGITTSTDPRGLFNYVTCYSTHAVDGAVPQGRQRTVGLINVNTAPKAVLMCLPGLSESDADAIVAYRVGNASSTQVNDTSWLASAVAPTTAQLIQPYITGQSYQYSADIVAVSGDGRAYKRVRIVVDARSQPAKIVYRKDLTALGWPLPASVRATLRAGRGLTPGVVGGG